MAPSNHDKPSMSKDADPPQFDPMFSAATFYDVLEAAVNIGRKPPTEVSANLRPAVVAFYGFKGGAGRTMALAHTAALLAERGARIVAIDLDLEAPGLDIIFDVDTPRDVDGTAALLRQAVMRPRGEVLNVSASLRPVSLPEASGSVLVLPAGRLNKRYLAMIEEIGLPLWHTLQPPHPLQRILEDISLSDVRPHAFFLDCRTGFHGLSATALFHVADLVVACFPLSPQVWDGLDILVDATLAARTLRQDARPNLLLVPTLVPPGPSGKGLLGDFLTQLEGRYGNKLGGELDKEASEDPDEPDRPWLKVGIPYESSLAAVGRLDKSLRTTTWGHFLPLADAVGAAFDAALSPYDTEPFDTTKVLEQLKIDRQAAFAEDSEISKLIDSFVPPGDLGRLLDRSIALIVGAKGAGKTVLFRYLVAKTAQPRPNLLQEMKYVVGHAPQSVSERGDQHLSAEALREIERDAKMATKGTHKAFWRLYAAARFANQVPASTNGIEKSVDSSIRGRVAKLLNAVDTRHLKDAIVELLLVPNIGTTSEAILLSIDQALLSLNHHVTLVYDGLDTGFDVGKDSEERQARFVSALLQLLLERRELRRTHFKIFLREDVFLRIEMQNKSHLDSARAELRWRPADLWRMTLLHVRESAEYKRQIASKPKGNEDPARIEEAELIRLLEPLWGATLQKKKAQTAKYIQKRTSDASDRLFPRTLMQLLAHAIDYERNTPSDQRDRVLGFAAIRNGLTKASEQRVEDLKSEYKEMGRYLDALRNQKPTWTRKALIEHLSRTVIKRPAGNRGGPEPGALHAGAGGWKNVIERLEQVGVLGDYTRVKGEDGKSKLQVALLYRPGLGIAD